MPEELPLGGLEVLGPPDPLMALSFWLCPLELPVPRLPEVLPIPELPIPGLPVLPIPLPPLADPLPLPALCACACPPIRPAVRSTIDQICMRDIRVSPF
jgi:hypothetical protein